MLTNKVALLQENDKKVVLAVAMINKRGEYRTVGIFTVRPDSIEMKT